MNCVNRHPTVLEDSREVDAELVKAACGLMLDFELIDFLAWVTTKIAVFRSEGSQRRELLALAEMFRRLSGRVDDLLKEEER